jgi:hypothetical protein
MKRKKSPLDSKEAEPSKKPFSGSLCPAVQTAWVFRSADFRPLLGWPMLGPLELSRGFGALRVKRTEVRAPFGCGCAALRLSLSHALPFLGCGPL